MKLLNAKRKKGILKICTLLRLQTKKLVEKEDGFGLNEFLGVACALIIGAFVIIPELRSLATDIMTRMDTWWGTIAGSIFRTT